MFGLGPKVPRQQHKGNNTKRIGNIFISKSIEGILKPYRILDTSAYRTDK